ncbi:UpxY family transcription antiterminator [bacterium]|nr:UpxY family transcription antiterminator [bacterium]
MNDQDWKVIYTGSRQEKKLAERLKNRGIPVYLPLYKKLSQWSDRKKWVEMPLFNGYLFVNPSDVQRDQVLQEKGAVAYLRFNGEDALVKAKEIQTIENILNSGYSMEGMSTPEDFESGDQARVLEGPLKGQIVDVIRRNNEEMFLVSFDTLGQSIKISLPYQVLSRSLNL